MRRIIERVVTVVTTTTWTISWQDDSIQPDSQAGSVVEEYPTSDVSHQTAKHVQNFSTVVTMKEADESETENTLDQTADEPSDNSYFDESKNEKEKS